MKHLYIYGYLLQHTQRLQHGISGGIVLGESEADAEVGAMAAMRQYWPVSEWAIERCSIALADYDMVVDGALTILSERINASMEPTA